MVFLVGDGGGRGGGVGRATAPLAPPLATAMVYMRLFLYQNGCIEGLTNRRTALVFLVQTQAVCWIINRDEEFH